MQKCFVAGFWTNWVILCFMCWLALQKELKFHLRNGNLLDSLMRSYFKLKNQAWRQLSYQFNSFLFLQFSFKKNWVKKNPKRSRSDGRNWRIFTTHRKGNKKQLFPSFLVESSRVEKGNWKLFILFICLWLQSSFFHSFSFFYVSFEQIETCQTYARECVYGCVCVCTLSDEMEKVNLYFFLALSSASELFL